MSVDRQHCVINIKRNKDNKLIYTLKDFDSLTGTFLYNKILDKNEIITLTEDPVITIGATTLIVEML